MKNFVVTKQTSPQVSNTSDIQSSEYAQSVDSDQSSFVNASLYIEAPLLTIDAEKMETGGEQHSKEQQHTDCSEFASDQAKIGRSGGAFIVRPYWKLKHKGIE
ncbi:unnamed protein product, partial [Rotaria sp. Silwood1]